LFGARETSQWNRGKERPPLRDYLKAGTGGTPEDGMKTAKFRETFNLLSPYCLKKEKNRLDW